MGRFVFTGLAIGFAAGAHGQSSDVIEALEADDECRFGSEGPACALNAAQLRAARTSVGGAAAIPPAIPSVKLSAATTATSESAASMVAPAAPQAEAVAAVQTKASAEATVNGSWSWSSGSKPAGSYNAKCYNHVGDTDCMASASKVDGRCVCDTGCMGADGNCYHSENKLLAEGFTISDQEFPDYKMYVQRMSVFGQLSTTSMSSKYNMGQDKFNLYELPGERDGKKQYFLASQKWPDYVVSLQNTGGTSFSLWAAYAVGLSKKHKPWDMKDVMIRVCSMRKKGHKNGVMLGSGVSTGGSTVWAYIHKGSWAVYGYWYPEQLIEKHIMAYGKKAETSEADPSVKTKPGEGGIWIPDPPFPAGLLPDC